MLTIEIPGGELWDPNKGEFITQKPVTISLEHSLVSISKWEAKWQKPFLSDKKTSEEMLDYIMCMTITQNVDPNAYAFLTKSNIDDIQKYIESPMTATTFSGKESPKRGKERVTSELIYYWMIANNIPFECQKWHINRLLTLIRVCSVKNAPPKKMGKRATMSQNTSLNAARRRALGTNG